VRARLIIWPIIFIFTNEDKMRTVYWYAVCECDADGKIIEGLSHWLYSNYDSALHHREQMQKDNPELKFVVLHLNKRG
jgi:hypothetical protein